MDYIRQQAQPVDKFSHQPRLYDLTRTIGAGQTYDDDVVFAAVWMHDLGVFVGHRPEEPAALANWDFLASVGASKLCWNFRHSPANLARAIVRLSFGHR